MCNSSAFDCDKSVPALVMTMSGGSARILLVLPMSAFVLVTGYQRWRPGRSFRTTGHSDFFTYNLAAIQLLSVSGLIVYFSAKFTTATSIETAGLTVYRVSFPAEVLIHSLTCVDRYLAVAHPVSYMKFKQTSGIPVRNVSVAVVWIVSLVFDGVLHEYYPNYFNEIFIGLLIVAVGIVSFCSVSVLCVLMRPGPGDMNRDRIDQAKRKAFHTMTALTVVVLLWFVGLLLVLSVSTNVPLDPDTQCVLHEAKLYLNVPCSVVLLALYISRQRNKGST